MTPAIGPGSPRKPHPLAPSPAKLERGKGSDKIKVNARTGKEILLIDSGAEGEVSRLRSCAKILLPRQAAHDRNRDFYLRSIGCTILRIPNQDLFEDRESVLTQILDAVNLLRARRI
jgi:hypothetical protein